MPSKPSNQKKTVALVLVILVVVVTQKRNTSKRQRLFPHSIPHSKVSQACLFRVVSILIVTPLHSIHDVPLVSSAPTGFVATIAFVRGQVRHRHDPFLVTVGGPSCPGDGAIVKIDLHGLWPQVMCHVVGDGSVHSDGGGGGVGQQGDEGVDLKINPINQGRGQSIQSIQSIKGSINPIGKK